MSFAVYFLYFSQLVQQKTSNFHFFLVSLLGCSYCKVSNVVVVFFVIENQMGFDILARNIFKKYC